MGQVENLPHKSQFFTHVSVGQVSNLPHLLFSNRIKWRAVGNLPYKP